MYVLLWLNTVADVQMSFIERIFVFFMTLFLKKMQAQANPWVLGKQLSQEICSKYVYRVLHAPKFEIFSTKLNMMMVKVVELFTGVL